MKVIWFQNVSKNFVDINFEKALVPVSCNLQPDVDENVSHNKMHRLSFQKGLVIVDEKVDDNKESPSFFTWIIDYVSYCLSVT
jgi:hypothetical protein